MANQKSLGGETMNPRAATIQPRVSTKKRLIRKHVFSMVPDPATIAAQFITVDTIDEVETLVRIVGNISVAPLIANPGTLMLMIRLRPSGTQLFTVAHSNFALAGKDAKSVLWHKTQQSSNDSANADPFIIDVETKSMRKLDAGDTITLDYVSDTDNGWNVSCVFTAFYKKA